MTCLEAWVVWSFEHDAWWAPGRWGYVENLVHAGHYTEAEALEIQRNANAYGRINERAMPLATAERPVSPAEVRGRGDRNRWPDGG